MRVINSNNSFSSGRKSESLPAPSLDVVLLCSFALVESEWRGWGSAYVHANRRGTLPVGGLSMSEAVPNDMQTLSMRSSCAV